MKLLKTLLLAGTVAAVSCSIAHAQFSYPSSLPGATLIYSNSFSGSGTTNITNTSPDFSTNILGGSANPLWLDVGGLGGQTNALHANGTIATQLGDTWLLPFTAKSGYVYDLSVSVNLNANPGSWVVACFAQHYTNYAIASAPPNGSINSYDWTLRNFTGNTEYFGGADASNPIYNATPTGPVNAGSYTFTQILDTTGSKWVATAFFDGVQLASPFTYSANPSIAAVGIGQHTETVNSAYQWTSLTLSGAPIVIGQQPVSANVDAGTAFTNTVLVAATSPQYQWYKDGVAISGATSSSLIFNSVSPTNADTNYYVVISNSLGSITSSSASLTVFTNPVIAAAYPVAYTNPITLFGGSTIGGSNYYGASPTFSVSALGSLPLTYQWLTNGEAVSGATSTSFTFTNCQMTSPTTFACVVSNSFGTTTNAWPVQYVATPTAPYPQAVLSNQPYGFWRLDEVPDDGGNGDDGVLAFDSSGGDNGIYTNAYFLGAGNGYNPVTDPNESSVDFSAVNSPNSCAFGIQGINFAAPTNTSSAVSVGVWVNGTSQANNAGIVAKGYLNAEQFVVDTTGGKYRFTVRNAGGTAYSAVATVGPNGAWQYVVGVCNEASSNVAIYVNGLLSASVAIPPNSGLLNSSVPMTIGARSTSATSGYDLQFSGELDDVAVFNYALSAGQVAILYGNPVPLTFVSPLPPTNVVFLANTTLTVPATVFGAPPLGYYWTNLTTATLLASGKTLTYGNLSATLTISNAPVSLSGDQLELVVTNATSSTNWFVSLFSPPPPLTLSYTSPILYSNYFNGGTWSIGGMPLTAANSLVGGTNTTWTDALGTNDTGSMMASGIDASTLGDSWVLPFTPHAGYIYTLTASLTFTGNPGSWVGLGFAQTVPINAAINFGRYADGGTTPPDQGPNGYDFIILTESSGNIQYFAGPAAAPAGTIANSNNFFPAGAGTHTVTVVLDTTGTQWGMSASVDGNLAGTNTYGTNPPIGAVGITQTTQSTPSNLQWNYLSLAQVAPGGVPPYLLNPLPPTNNILLTNATVSVPATAFGSAPLGYYWSDNSTVVASGSTNTMAPLPASLSVSSSSLSPGQLELVVTNAFGTNITLITLISPINPLPGLIQHSLAGNQLTLSWPTNLGWILQAQTNSVVGTNWVNVAGSASTNQITIPISTNVGSVYYRLINP